MLLAFTLESPGELCSILVERPWSPPVSTPRPGRLESCHRPLTDDLTLEFRQGPEDVEDETAAGRGRVQTLLQAAEAHAPALQLPHQIDELPQRPTQPVEPRHHQDVPLAAVVERLPQGAPLRLPAGDLFLEDLLATVRQECVALGLQPLVFPRHPGVPDPHGPIGPKTVSISSTAIKETGRSFGTRRRSCGTPFRDSEAASPIRALERRTVRASHPSSCGLPMVHRSVEALVLLVRGGPPQESYRP